MEAPKTNSETDVLRLLMSKEGVQVIKQPVVYFSETISYEGFETARHPNQVEFLRMDLKYAVQTSKTFLSGVVITDSFTEHGERRSWRFAMLEKYGKEFAKVYSKNKLRINNLYAVQLAFKTLLMGIDDLETISDKVERVKKIITQFPELKNYDALTVKERLDLVQHVDEICKSFLEIVMTSEPTEHHS